jgi:hypothetical protein
LVTTSWSPGRFATSGAFSSSGREASLPEALSMKICSQPAAVLVGADEWESLQETLYWLSQPRLKESIAEAEADIAAGRTFGEDEIRAEFGVPRRTD